MTTSSRKPATVEMTYDAALYQRQVELEEEMTAAGVERYQVHTGKAKAKGEESNTSYGSTLIRELTQKVEKQLLAFLEVSASGKAGRRHASVKHLTQLDPRVASYIALKAVVNGISREAPLTATLEEIGGLIEDEIRFRGFKAENAKLYNRMDTGAKKRISYGNKLQFVRHSAKKNDLDWLDWSREDRIRVGEKMLDCVASGTGIVSVENSIISDRQTRTASGCKKEVAKIMPSADLKDWIEKREELDALLTPVYMPMVVPPVDWNSTSGGGYLTNNVRPYTLIKSYKHVCREADAVDMPLVYAAVNAMQRVPWQVNSGILEIIREGYRSNATWMGIPPSELREVPPKPFDIAENEVARKEWRIKAAIVHQENALTQQERITFNALVNQAVKFSEFDQIFFPYALDFRGRVYAMPQLNPQGRDYCKALLQFGEAKPLGEGGVKWLMIHGANVAGVDKVSFQERVDFITENEEEILSIASDPFTTRSWVKGFAPGNKHEKKPGKGLDIDKPWQFLAFCLEYAEMVRLEQDGENAEDFMSRLPIALDGSCSGIQHYSMALRDDVGGVAVNIVPSDKPSDIYALVAVEVEAQARHEVSTNGEDAHLAKLWLDYGITRKVCKRPVMTFPYGSAQFGYKEQTMEDILNPIGRTLKEGEKHPFGEDQGHKAAGYLAKQIALALPKVITKAAEGMAYLKAVARVVSAEGQPIQWRTPLGFPVYQATYKEDSSVVNTMLFGRRIQLTVDKEAGQEGREIDQRAQENAIAPNFIHSLDATHLQLTVVRASEAGIGSLALIHDSFGTHAGESDKLFSIIREAMVELYSEHDVFAEFTDYIRQQVSEGENTDKLNEVIASMMPKHGTLDPVCVMDSLYAFA